MRTKLLVPLLAVLLIAAADKDNAAKKDQDKLQGAWKVVSAEHNGQARPDRGRPPYDFRQRIYDQDRERG